MDDAEMLDAKKELNTALGREYLRGSTDMLDAFVAGLMLIDANNEAIPEVRGFINELATTTQKMKTVMIAEFAKEGIEL